MERVGHVVGIGRGCFSWGAIFLAISVYVGGVESLDSVSVVREVREGIKSVKSEGVVSSEVVGLGEDGDAGLLYNGKRHKHL